jgi:hypothetical protein
MPGAHAVHSARYRSLAIARERSRWLDTGMDVEPTATRLVPPGSTPLRELAHAVDQALTLPGPATTRDELTYLRIMRDRARLVRQAMRRLIADREADHGDVMQIVASMRDETAQLADDATDHEPEPTRSETAP